MHRQVCAAWLPLVRGFSAVVAHFGHAGRGPKIVLATRPRSAHSTSKTIEPTHQVVHALRCRWCFAVRRALISTTRWTKLRAPLCVSRRPVALRVCTRSQPQSVPLVTSRLLACTRSATARSRAASAQVSFRVQVARGSHVDALLLRRARLGHSVQVCRVPGQLRAGGAGLPREAERHGEPLHSQGAGAHAPLPCGRRPHLPAGGGGELLPGDLLLLPRAGASPLRVHPLAASRVQAQACQLPALHCTRASINNMAPYPCIHDVMRRPARRCCAPPCSAPTLVSCSPASRAITRAPQVQTEFKSKHGEKAKTASAGAFDRQFSPRLKYHMEYCMNNPGEISKIHRVKAKVDEVKGIMVQNIERVRTLHAAAGVAHACAVLALRHPIPPNAPHYAPPRPVSRRAAGCMRTLSRGHTAPRLPSVPQRPRRTTSQPRSTVQRRLCLRHVRIRPVTLPLSTFRATPNHTANTPSRRCSSGASASRSSWTKQRTCRARRTSSGGRDATCATRCGGRT